MQKSKPKSKPRQKNKLAEELADLSASDIDKILAEKSLHQFVLQAWNIIEPETPFADNWHIKAICEHLEAVTDGRIGQLLINVPPGTMKSLLTNVFWPAWVWTTNQSKRFMFSSYAEDLSMRDSVKCRDLIMSEWYQQRWPIELSVDQNTKGKFQNTKRGWRMIGSIGGKGTGEHPDFNCLRGDTLLTCRHGSVEIKQIVEDGKPIEVLSFNHATGEAEWKRAYSFSKRNGKPCLKIKTSSGKEFSCTKEHPVFVAGVGYIEARFLQVGHQVFSEVCRVRKEINETATMGTAKILFSKMPRHIYSGRPSPFISRPILVPLSNLQKKGNASDLRESQKAKILFCEVSRKGDAQTQRIKTLPAMPEENNGSAVSFEKSEILFKTMRVSSSPQGDGGQKQSKIRSREIAGAIQERIYCGGSKGEKPGSLLSNVRRRGKSVHKTTGRSPHRLRQDKQRLALESRHTLPEVPRNTAWQQAQPRDLDTETIIAIEDAGTPDFVFNIGVEENHNYFANGVLTHNCADDPHNVQQAESEQERQNVVDWIDSVFSTRGVSRGVRKVVIMQRLHHQDASGHLISKGGWVHICLPMRYEAPALVVQPDGKKKLTARMNPTPLGWTDPRKKDGELLWEKLYPESVVETLEVNLGIYHSAGQLQQRPAPRGGGTFKRVWFEILSAIPQLDKTIRYWDKSGTKGGSGAQTAGVLIASWTDAAAALPAMKKKYIILDVITCRESAAEREAVIKQTAATDKAKWGHVETWVEQEPGSGGKESAEGTIGNLSGFVCKVERVTGSKEVRADPLASQASVGKVKILSGAWNQSFLDELEHFPVGKLKDQVDAAGGGFNKLNTATGSFESTEGIRVGTTSSAEQFEVETLTADDLGIENQ